MAEKYAFPSLDKSGANAQLVQEASEAWMELTNSSSSSARATGPKSSQQEDMTNKSGRRSSYGPALPGAEHIPSVAQLGVRVSVRYTHDDDRRSQRERAKASVGAVSGSPGAKSMGKDDQRDKRNEAKADAKGNNSKTKNGHEQMLGNRGNMGAFTNVDGHDSSLGEGLSRLDERINTQAQKSGGRTLGFKKLGGVPIDSSMDSRPGMPDDPDGPRVEISRGNANDGGIEYGRLPFQRGGRDAFGDEGDLAVAIAVNDEDNAFFPSAIEYDPNKKPPIYQNRRFRLYLGTGCLLLIMIIVAVSFVVVKQFENTRNSDNSVGNQITESRSISPTPAPTTAPTTASFQGMLVEISKLTSVALLNDINTPQGKAFKWIHEDDPRQLSARDEFLFQRYALVVMYYSLQENGPWATCGEEDNRHQNSTLCDGRKTIFPPGADEGVYEEVPDEGKWLSVEHECNWFGIFCEEDDSVVIIEISE
eukprot:scaffold15022_cov50-Attheya_sp.AAC.2